jgi:hypothetical protein
VLQRAWSFSYEFGLDIKDRARTHVKGDVEVFELKIERFAGVMVDDRVVRALDVADLPELSSGTRDLVNDDWTPLAIRVRRIIENLVVCGPADNISVTGRILFEAPNLPVGTP